MFESKIKFEFWCLKFFEIVLADCLREHFLVVTFRNFNLRIIHLG